MYFLKAATYFFEDPIRSDLKKSSSNVAYCKRVWDPIRKKRYRSYGYGAQQVRGLDAHAGGRRTRTRTAPYP